jgi:hypothetical protein
MTLITKHLAKSLATSKGDIRMQQQNVQSTKIIADLDLATCRSISSPPKSQATQE